MLWFFFLSDRNILSQFRSCIHTISWLSLVLGHGWVIIFQGKLKRMWLLMHVPILDGLTHSRIYNGWIRVNTTKYTFALYLAFVLFHFPINIYIHGLAQDWGMSNVLTMQISQSSLAQSHSIYFYSSSLGQNGCHFADNIFRCIFVNEKFVFWLKFHCTR